MRNRAVQHPVAVGLSLRVQPAVEPFRNLLDGDHADILRKIRVDLLHQRFRRKLRIHMKIRRLPVSVHSRVRPSRSLDLHRLSGDP